MEEMVALVSKDWDLLFNQIVAAPPSGDPLGTAPDVSPETTE